MSTATLPAPSFVLTPARRRRHAQRLKRQGLLPAVQQQLRTADQLLGLRRLGRLDAADLREVAEEAVPNAIDESSWRGDIPELADKIQREAWGLLEATEARVKNADREIVLKGLPPCVEVGRDDVRYK